MSYFKDFFEKFYDVSEARHLIADDKGKEIIDYINSQCASQNTQFVDIAFPPFQQSINAIPEDEAISYVSAEIVWKRPIHLSTSPVLFDSQIEPSDVVQGSVGNCWMCGQFASLATNPSYFYHRIYPQKLNVHGIYGIRVYRRGTWYWILVDDWLPTTDGSLCFLKSKNPNEFYSALYEKAMAKIRGSYQQLSAGMSTGLEPISVLSGLSCYVYCDPKNPDALFYWMERHHALNTFMSCSSSYVGEGDGLVQGHAYSVLGVYRNDQHGIKLVKLRNTWGHSGEWAGAWSDSSDMWRRYPDVLAATGHTLASGATDGVFYIPHTDFARVFTGARFFPLNATWPPADRTHVPRGLLTPMSGEYCYGDDFKKHKGGEGYEVLSSVTASLAEPLYGAESDRLYPHNNPQYLVHIPSAMSVRIRVQSSPSAKGGYPWLTVFSAPDDATQYTARRLDGLVSQGDTDKPEDVVFCSSFTSWTDQHLEAGKYVVSLCQGLHFGSPLLIEAKARQRLNFQEIMPGDSHVLGGSTCSNCSSWSDLGNMAQYTVTVRREMEISLAARWPSAAAHGSRSGLWIFKVMTQDQVAERVYGLSGWESAPYPIREFGTGNTAILKCTLPAGYFVFCVCPGVTGVDSDFVLTLGTKTPDDARYVTIDELTE